MKTTVTHTTETGKTVADLIDSGLEVSAEIAHEEPEAPQGVDEDVLAVVRKYGLKDVLASIQMAAWSAAEVHEDTDAINKDAIETATAVLRLRLFTSRIGRALETLK